MASAPLALPGSRQQSGPLVWAGIIGATCLLLAALQKLLWLTVPFLLALILYYMLQPVMVALIYRGMRRETAAGTAMAGFLGALMLIGMLSLPHFGARLLDWQATLMRYLHGGNTLLDRSLRVLETNWGMLADAHVADAAAARLAEVSGSMTGHIRAFDVGDSGLGAGAAAHPLSRIFLPARRPGVPALSGSGCTECLFRAHAQSACRGGSNCRCLFSGLALV